MDCVIIAAGLGKRLRPLTNNQPKCMVKINGKPILQYQIEWLKKYGIDRIIVACGYKHEKIKRYFGNSLIYSTEPYNTEKDLLGTSGSLKRALKFVNSDRYLMIFGDEIHSYNPHKFMKLNKNTIVITKFKSPFGIIESKNGVVTNWKGKVLLSEYCWCGAALLNKKIRLLNRGSLDDALKKLKLRVFKIKPEEWVTINNLKDVEEAKKRIK